MLNKNRFEDAATIVVGDKNKVSVKNDIKKKKNDFEALEKYLKSFNIEQKDIDNLKNAINKDRESESNGIGDSVRNWILEVVAKTTGKLKDIGISKAVELVENGIKSYLGV